MKVLLAAGLLALVMLGGFALAVGMALVFAFPLEWAADYLAVTMSAGFDPTYWQCFCAIIVVRILLPSASSSSSSESK